MTSSRARLLAAVSAIAFAGLAAAQDAPRPRDPGMPSGEPSGSQPFEPGRPSDGAPDPGAPSLGDPLRGLGPDESPFGEPAPAPGGTRQRGDRGDKPGAPGTAVDVDRLGEVDASAAGTLSTREAGLPPDVWSGSDYGTLQDLLAGLSPAMRSPASSALVRRLLLVAAEPPADRAGGPSLIELRAQKLLEAGRIADLAALMKAAPQDNRALEPMRAVAYLLAGDDRTACGPSTARLRSADDVFGLQLRALCQAIGGDLAVAAQTAEVAQARGVRDDAFFALLARLTDGAPAPALDAAVLSPIAMALVRLTRTPLAATGLESAPPAVLALIAADASQDVGLRRAAAERAAASGAIDLEDFLALALDGPAPDAASESLVRLRDAVGRSKPGERAALLAEALAATDAQGLTLLYAGAFARAAWEIPPNAAFAPQGPAVARILLLSGRGDRAADWLGVLPAGAAADELAVALAFAAPAPQRDQAAVAALVRLAKTAAPADRRVAIFAGCLEALGVALPPDVQGFLAASPLLRPAPSMGHAGADMMDAARGGRAGEAILKALALLGPGGPAEADPAIVVEAVAALHAAGLTAEARAMALEGALGRAAPPPI